MARGPQIRNISHSTPRWYALAECQGSDTTLFISTDGVSTSQRHEYERMAKSICEVCSVQEQCLEYALENPKAAPFGIWGGASERQRKTIRAERNRKRKRRAS